MMQDFEDRTPRPPKGVGALVLHLIWFALAISTSIAALLSGVRLLLG